jgi:antitoxin (DNA-binding transcriptional repressor) of toxin-antitoxin stability system
MAEPAAPIPYQSLQLSVLEARTRFPQLIRMATLNHQITTITDAGRPIAVIAPPDAVRAGEPAIPGRVPGPGAAAGWARRIEQVREDVRRQHEGRVKQLEQALDQAWQAIDAMTRTADADIEALRIAHADVRR